jgi:hypothetical protein
MGDDGVAHGGGGGRVGMPQAAAAEDLVGLKVEVETGGVHVFAGGVAEVQAGVGLVGRLVFCEARVAVDAEDRAAVGPRIGDEVRTDLAEVGREVDDELDQRLAHVALEARPVLLEPVAVIVLLQLAQEVEEGGTEVGGLRGARGCCGHGRTIL